MHKKNIDHLYKNRCLAYTVQECTQLVCIDDNNNDGDVQYVCSLDFTGDPEKYLHTAYRTHPSV